MVLGFWDGEMCIPNLFCFRIARSISVIIIISKHIFQLLLLCHFSYYLYGLDVLYPKIQQLHTVLRAVYLPHRCCSLSNILETHTVHSILRHDLCHDCSCW
jgi:hypothetical protein